MPPLSIPYATASPAQRQQALLSARRVLDAAFPHLSRAQWVAALDQVQPPVLAPTDQPAQLTLDGLAALTSHLALAEGQEAAPTPAPAALPPGRKSSAAARKQTYVVTLDLLQQLANVSYWCRIPINHLVLLALTQLLSHYPEARRPRPGRDQPSPPD